MVCALRKDEGHEIIRWKLVADHPITAEEAIKAQNPDKPVAGYGFFQFVCQPVGEHYEATWKSYASFE